MRLGGVLRGLTTSRYLLLGFNIIAAATHAIIVITAMLLALRHVLEARAQQLTLRNNLDKLLLELLLDVFRVAKGAGVRDELVEETCRLAWNWWTISELAHELGRHELLRVAIRAGMLLRMKQDMEL